MSKANAAIAVIIAEFQDRLTRVAGQTRQNTDAIAELRDGLRSAMDDKNRKQDAAIEVLQEMIQDVKSENDKREAAQTLRDQNNVQALTNLRDSTQKAFNQVRDDVANLLKQIQRLNERMGQVESRVSKLEVPQPSAIDQFVVNSKLNGVYDVTDSLEIRIEKLEKVLEVYENLRKAQAEVAKANGAFLAL